MLSVRTAQSVQLRATSCTVGFRYSATVNNLSLLHRIRAETWSNLQQWVMGNSSLRINWSGRIADLLTPSVADVKNGGEMLLLTRIHDMVFSARKTSLFIKQYSNQYVLGYGFHFHHRNSRTFPIESLAHDSGRTLVCAEYGYPKGSPNTNS
jgi:hypothetical protein